MSHFAGWLPQHLLLLHALLSSAFVVFLIYLGATHWAAFCYRDSVSIHTTVRMMHSGSSYGNQGTLEY